MIAETTINHNRVTYHISNPISVFSYAGKLATAELSELQPTKRRVNSSSGVPVTVAATSTTHYPSVTATSTTHYPSVTATSTTLYTSVTATSTTLNTIVTATSTTPNTSVTATSTTLNTIVTANSSMSSKIVTAAAGIAGCPTGRFVTINASGRLGNKLCQYASFWCLQQDDVRSRHAWVLPEMQRALEPLFSGLSLPVLPEACAKRTASDFWKVSYHKFSREADAGPLDRPWQVTDHPCDLHRIARHIEPLLQQLTFRAEVKEEAQRRLRRHTDSLCRGPPACTFVGVHVRRTDYSEWMQWRHNKTLAGEAYLTRALALCRRRYRRVVFVVCSDDLTWVRRRLSGPDVIMAGSTGADSAGRDLALLAQCNHTVATHGTYGFMASFLARGDVLVPAGYGARAASFVAAMRARGFNSKEVPTI